MTLTAFIALIVAVWCVAEVVGDILALRARKRQHEADMNRTRELIAEMLKYDVGQQTEKEK